MKLSIITINLNNCEGLSKTIESVVCQTFTDFEYIIIDGGSTDGSVEIIKQHADKITYWVSEPDKGIYNAMNKGILQAKGEYCLFLNSGDCLIENAVLDRAFTVSNETDLLICKLKDQEKNHGLIKPKKEITFYDFFISSLPHGSTFIKRSLFEDIGLYRESYKIVSDWIFFLEAVVEHQVSYFFTDVVLSSFEKGGISSTLGGLQQKERSTYFHKNYICFISDYQVLNFYKTSRIVKYWGLFKKWISKCCGKNK